MSKTNRYNYQTAGTADYFTHIVLCAESGIYRVTSNEADINNHTSQEPTNKQVKNEMEVFIMIIMNAEIAGAWG